MQAGFDSQPRLCECGREDMHQIVVLGKKFQHGFGSRRSPNIFNQDGGHTVKVVVTFNRWCIRYVLRQAYITIGGSPIYFKGELYE